MTHTTILRDALTAVRTWLEDQRKSISKGNGSSWDMMQCSERINLINAALAAADAGQAPFDVLTRKQKCDIMLNAAQEVDDFAEASPVDILNSECNAMVFDKVIAAYLAARPAPVGAAPVQDADEADADHDTIMRMGRMLAEIAITMKGEEAPRQRHGYADLPELVKVMAMEIDIYRTVYGRSIPEGWENGDGKAAPVGAVQAPIWQEPTGEMWSAGRDAFLKYARQWEDAKTSELSSVIADIAPGSIFNAMQSVKAAAPAAPIGEAKPVLWAVSEEATRGHDLREVINGCCHTVMYHSKEPSTNNPIWPLYTHPAEHTKPEPVEQVIDSEAAFKTSTESVNRIWNAAYQAGQQAGAVDGELRIAAQAIVDAIDVKNDFVRGSHIEALRTALAASANQKGE